MIDFSPLTFLSILLVITSVVVFEIRELRWATYAYAVQTFILVSIFVTLSVTYDVEPLLLWATTAFVTKIVLVPLIILKLIKRINEKPVGVYLILCLNELNRGNPRSS